MNTFKFDSRLSPITPNTIHSRHTTTHRSLGAFKNTTPLISPWCRRRSTTITTRVSPFDQAWGTSLDLDSINQVLPQNLFAFSLFPYIGFLYHLTKSKQTPPLTLFGFYFLLVFVFATIPAGIYAKKVYGTSLANVDYLHGTAEFMLTLTNLFIVLGLRKAIREANDTTAKSNSGSAAAITPTETDVSDA